MVDILQYGFMRNALVSGVIIGIACGVIGSLVVVNRAVFLAGGIAHAVYGGIGLALFGGFSPVLGATFFALLVSSAMGLVTLRWHERMDTIIGVLWATGMAIGIILIDLTPGYHKNVLSYLFGSILVVPDSDLYIIAGLNLLLVGTVVLFYKEFLAISFDQEFAMSSGIPVKIFQFIFLWLVGLAVVMMMRIVGLILVIALFSIPASISERFTPSLKKMMLFSSVFAILFCLGGLMISYYYNLTSGATIVLVAAISYFAFLGIGDLIKKAASS